MAQHDMNIANQGFPATRADLNNALQALVSNSSGTSAPSTTFANQWWYDTTNNKMYIRNEANNAWIEVAVLDQTNNEWQITTGVVKAKDSDGLALKTDDGTTRLFIKDSDGNIGIGTSNPDRSLHIAGNPGMIILEDTGGGTDDKRAAIFADSGVFEIASKNDDDSTRLNDIFVADLGTGAIRMGDTGGTDTARQKSFIISHQAPASSEYGGVEFFRAHQNSQKVGASIMHVRPGSSLDDSDLVFKTSTSNTNATERMRILHNGGLTFNGDTAAANALNDYEEGTFTPTYNADSGTITTGSNAGKYVKIGDMVHCHFRIRSTGVSSISGAISITGFPFTPVSDGRSAGSKWFARDWATDMPNFSFGVVAGTTYASLYKHAMNASASSVSNFNFGTGSDDNVLEASITYQVA